MPLIIILIPGLKSIPALFRWRMSLRINRWYRLLLLVEQDAMKESSPGKQALLAGRIDEIESEVHAMKVPASYGGQFYVLRAHINFVRNKLQSLTKGGRNDV